MTNVATTAGSAPWYRTLNRNQWKALVASNLGWTFDGFEVFSLILTVGVALHQLLDASDYKLIPAYAGAVIAITVFGWGLGGLFGGILADYIGRKRLYPRPGYRAVPARDQRKTAAGKRSFRFGHIGQA